MFWQILLYGIFGLAMVNGLIGYSAVRRFLSRTKAIDGPVALDAFKQMVRLQMYLALMQMVCLGAGCLIGVLGILFGGISLTLVIVLNGIIIVAAQLNRSAEERARSLPVADEQLAASYRSVCLSWVGKPFPDF